MTSNARKVEAIRAAAVRIDQHSPDDDALLDIIGDARIVLLGEATHGTHDFYAERCRISRRLIEERGFEAIAVEADWPDAYRVNRYVRGASDDDSPEQSLADFRRFPLWMWRNTDVVEMVAWVRSFNDGRRSGEAKVGFYGLDLYSLFSSIAAVIEYLRIADPPAAERAMARYSCFDHFDDDSQAYGYAASLGISESCERAAVEQLVELQKRAGELAALDGRIPEDEFFFASQNARLVKNAEEYYRTMFRGRVSSWNLRDRHMADTLEALGEHLAGKGLPPKIVVWAHNSHLGDARATQMGASGEWNVGQLARERFGRDVRSIGFTTYTGFVTAARDWDEPPEQRWVRPALNGSVEALLHEAEMSRFMLDLADPTVRSVLADPLLERAIGVIYRPETERGSHYFAAAVPEQFDAVIHIDETSALVPLDRSGTWDTSETPDTYPFEV